MAISFNNIPSDLRVPLFYAEIDNTQAGFLTQNLRLLLIGQMSSGSTATAGAVELVSSTDNAKTLFGVGSMLARMHQFARNNDPLGEIWCIPLADDGAAVAATGTITITGTATASGTLYIYIGGQLVKSAVTSGDSANTVAATLEAAIDAVTDLPVTASVSTNVVTLTAKWAGATGNDITILHNYLGQAAGERTPAGVSVAIGAMSSGATDPSLAAAITAMGDEEYDFIFHPYALAANLNLMQTEMNDSSGRWSYARQIYGHAYSAKRDTFSNLQSFGSGRNDQHHTVAGMETGIPTPAWEFGSAYAVQCAISARENPARPTQTKPLIGVLPAPIGSRFTLTERQTLLKNGIATSKTVANIVQIERSITTYQLNSFGQPDTSYLDSETLHTSAEIIRQLRFAVTQKYPRHLLASDGTNFGAGTAVVTPNIIRGEMIAVYRKLELRGLVENAELFAKFLLVERDVDAGGSDPNRVNVLFPADYVNQLRVFALLNQFRLQFPQAA